MLLVRSSATLGQASGDSTGGRALVGIQEKIVEVIKVILREQCQRVLFFLLTACGTAHSHTRELAYFDSVWEGGCGLHAKSVCCPTAHPHTRGLILSASDGIRNMLFSTHSHTSHLLHCCCHSVLRLGNCLLCLGSGEVFVVPLVLDSLTMGTFWWARSHASGAGLVRDLRAANWWTQPQRDGSSEWKTPRVWYCSSHFAQNGEAEEHPASP